MGVGHLNSTDLAYQDDAAGVWFGWGGGGEGGGGVNIRLIEERPRRHTQ